MLEPRIQQHFFESADQLYQVAEPMARPIADAAQLIVACLTGGGKLLVAGEGRARWLARAAASALQQGFERERPPLAACLLGDGALPGPRALAQSVAALGQGGDLLLLFSLADEDPAAQAALDEAHQRDLNVVLLGAGLAAPWASLLSESDVWIAAPVNGGPRAMELLLLALHALCDAIDVQLLGEADEP
ncbi:SIS domain-containing protein [Ideonella sp. 4Y16]|uniref:SIS domain-containing protein n=1 Tax=Ideonella alba TaxID=2824118 RepID=A0A940Y8J5_9BURK|nr:SIS domain-containing protein [Ideonella alba]MBQ0930160.1 SIS domain-containing protein [Ideonella alba]MBQ0943228.1 SIS domain-containing protein [Ideonella alba]